MRVGGSAGSTAAGPHSSGPSRDAQAGPLGTAAPVPAQASIASTQWIHSARPHKWETSSIMVEGGYGFPEGEPRAQAKS